VLLRLFISIIWPPVFLVLVCDWHYVYVVVTPILISYVDGPRTYVDWVLMIRLVIGFCSVWNTSPRAVIANALRYKLFEGKNSIITNAHYSIMIYDLLNFFTL
jgi:hypothetical protein